MKIAIIGAGNVGGTLGKGWAKHGHTVTFAVRDVNDPKLQSLLRDAPGAKAAPVAEAVAASEIVVLATPWDANEAALRGAGNLAGKVLLDCTNPLKADFSGLAVGYTTSGAEMVAGWAKGARVVKIFNTTGFPNMANPRYAEGPVVMFYCGDDAAAKADAAKLATDLGFEAKDAGELAIARLLEPYAMLWIHLAMKQGFGTGFAFKLMKR
ncbi:MAG: NAD(P)-binding domain-containing protein [Acidipila sp.]|nr:NAD(P)-binding domain-containing protein [Acidipila sp.]